MIDIAAAVAEARAAADAIHTDLCTITRRDPNAPGGWTEADGDTPPGTLSVASDLPCRVRQPTASERTAAAGEHQWSLTDRILQVGATVTGISIGDSVTVTSSPQGVDIAGPYTIVALHGGSHVSSRRFVIVAS